MRTFLALFFFWAFTAQASPVPLTGRDLVKGSPVTIDPAASAKGTVVVFVSSKCPCSQSHEPTVAKLAGRFKDFTFLGVNANADETEAEAKEHFAKAALPFPVVRDEGGKLADRLGALKTPHAFVLGRDGEVLFSGGVDDSHLAESASEHFLADALSAIRDGKAPARKQVRALGCVIQR